jgi:flagellin
VNAVSAAIATSAAGTDSNSTAFRNANITASISADGESFALNSSTSAFMVKEGDAASRAFLGTDAATVAKVAGGLQSKAIGFTPIGGGQSQVITVSTTDDAGTLHSKDITLNGALTADTAADAINTALRGTGNAELMKIVAAESGSGLNEISFAGLRNFQITVQAPSTGGQGLAGPGATASSALVTGGGNVAIATKSGAEDAVNKLNDAVSQLGVAQAVVGKGQNQFNYAVSLASTQLTNLAASESRIRDADLALEAANLTRAQILQQAGIAALAQANSAPQAVLSLLRG